MSLSQQFGGVYEWLAVASEQTKANIELEKKLENTESARAEAMRKLSDMNQS